MGLAINEVTRKIIACAYTVSNELGHGFLEKIYENALAIELDRQGLRFRQQAPISVRYRGRLVGEFYADLLVEDAVIVELKTTTTFHDAHLAQALNYLKATNLSVALLISFGASRVQIKRVINKERSQSSFSEFKAGGIED